MPTSTHRLALAAALALLAAPTIAQIPEEFTNPQVFPKDIEQRRLVGAMRYAGALAYGRTTGTAAGLRSLKREIALFRLLKEELGARPDIARLIDWSLDQAPYFIESEHTEGGSLVEWAERRGGIDRVPQTSAMAMSPWPMPADSTSTRSNSRPAPAASPRLPADRRCR